MDSLRRAAPSSTRPTARVLAASAAAIVSATIAVLAQAPPPAPPGSHALSDETLTEIVAAGRSWRLDLPSGPVRVWIPASFHPDGAAIVLYVHGYYTDVDRAWSAHRLPEQFALSAINAVFIAPEAPSGSRQGVHFPSLSELLVDVFAAIAVPRPMGPVVAIGHSGAHRTLRAWMEFPGLDILVALDAMYDQVDDWRDWLDAAPRRRLIVVGEDTLRWTETLARDLGAAVESLDGFPEPGFDPRPNLDRARVIYVRSQYTHMALATDGMAVPQLLRWLPIETLAEGPWQRPLGLPPVDAAVPAIVPPP